MQLADLQRDLAGAVIQHEDPSPCGLLTGGDAAARRFAIHRRHYAASLARSLVERFAATVWLAGAEFVTEAAMRFVRQHPPRRPCIAEYGEGFPACLASFGGTRLPYLEQFATLDWHLGRLAVAVDTCPVRTLAYGDEGDLLDVRLTLQTGTQYVAVDWSLDDLMGFYLAGDAPTQYALRSEAVWLELRGCRGDLWWSRLTRGDYVFRTAVADGSTLGRAAESAMNVDEGFDPGSALLALFNAGLVAGVSQASGADS